MTSAEERQAYLDELVRARGYVLDYHKVLAEKDFEALKAMNGLIEAVYLKERHLDRKTKELLFVLSLTVMRSEKGHVKSHIKAALDAGASEEEVLEAIEISLPEAGVVAFQHGFEAWKEVTGATGLEPTVDAYEGGWMTRTLSAAAVTSAVRDLCIEANTELPPSHLAALRRAHEAEESTLGREVIGRLLENARVARERCVAFCQDTGYAVFFVELGSEVGIEGGELGEAIDEGVRRGYDEGYLRKSIVQSPIDRTNTNDNTPAVIYYDLVPGEDFKLTMLVKGAGCDNMSALKMLTPAEGVDGMKRFVVETIERAGPNASPPLTVGVGIGGPFERAALLAKKALTRSSGEPNPDPELAALERELLDEINATGIGPAGYGGTQTALAVHVESFPTHIAAFPVAVNLDCHSHRTASVEL